MPPANHVLMIEPVGFRANDATRATNAFQRDVPLDAGTLAARALAQHRALRDRLIEHGVAVTCVRGAAEAPDATFCNNWFSTHAPARDPATFVLYPMLAENRRIERRADLIARLSARYPRVIDLSSAEAGGRYLEGTGSLVIDADARVAYAALSPRTDRGMAAHVAATLGLRLVAFTARDADGRAYYHTNVMMFVGHDLAGICLDSIDDADERAEVERALRDSKRELLPLTRTEVGGFCGNVLALANDRGEPLWVMSSTAFETFSAAARARLAHHGAIVHAPLDAFEHAGGGSARCLLAELY